MRIVVVFLFLAAVAAMAQQSTPSPSPAAKAPAAKKTGPAAAWKTASSQSAPADAPTREEVLKLFDLLQINTTMEIAVKTARAQSREMAEQMIQERAPDATLEQRKQLEAMINDVMDQALGPAAMQQIMDATVPIYQKHLTKADLKAMMGFYTSPVGKKILREQPAMVEESMQAATSIQERIARSMFQRIDQRMQEIMGPDKEKQP
jgi:hypothetical protein